MSIYVLENEEIAIKADSFGAELKSLVHKKTGREYMWSGDAKYWGRVSPVLFPVVGAYRDKTCRYMGQEYHLPQHGFARDSEFSLKEQTKDCIWFALEENVETLQNYPFAFRLEIGYRITGREVEVMWRVENKNDGEMYFSIGGHPAFAAPERKEDTITAYLQLEGVNSIKVRELEGGLASDIVKEIPAKGGILPVTEELFAKDALIVEHSQTKAVSLLNAEKEPYLTVKFDAPLFGLWTPPGKNAPFICIEPWYGRCDGVHFDGNLEEREWGNILTKGEHFAASYRICI